MKIPVLLAAALLAASPSLQAEDLPPLNDSPSGLTLPGKFIWADLFTTDPAAATRFYCSLFGWSVTPVNRGSRRYILLSNEGRAVAGVTLRPRRAASSEPGGRWVGYVSVPDVARCIALATAAGGQVIIPPREVPRRGTLAVFADREGAVLGLLHSSTGDPPDYLAEPGEWAWAELFARDSQAAADRYARLLGYEATADSRSDKPGVFVLASGGYARAGLAPVPGRPDASPGWLGFVRVGSVDQAVAQATALGGRVLVAPKAGKIASRVAVLEDTVGAAIGVLELSDGQDPKETP